MKLKVGDTVVLTKPEDYVFVSKFLESNMVGKVKIILTDGNEIYYLIEFPGEKFYVYEKDLEFVL